MYAVTCWDWILTFPKEWRYIWKTSWTPVKVAYLFCRYWVLITVPYLLWAFVVQHPLETCEKVYRIPVMLAMWNQAAAEIILLIRTYAFFNRNSYMLAFLVAALSGVIAFQLYVASSQMLLLPFVSSPTLGPCFPRSRPGSADLLGFFIAPLAFDTIVTLITVAKAVAMRRRSGGSNSRLIQTFLREGVFYYMLISVANLVNGIFYLQPRQVMSAICIPLSVMLAPVLACHLILDLRERGAETVAQSAGTIAFTAGVSSNKSNPASPFSGIGFGFGSPSSSKALVRPSGVLLSTIGSIPMEGIVTVGGGVELDNMQYGLESESSVDKDVELGLGSTVDGIRVDVEKTTM
ncbi:hypothetical protein DAEQUDRAFT_14666 [Daedalea quercina L-15889]|uniref:DUF6533 domain-containing protein n=1 Tax=Daedalea quercina L-15889 TaxID=1314783 RepID=A0A165UIB1_9APHY|nr:hypothetical protein DAEQUDRAFT_14666 [Daedalea quercina L-15889]